MQRGNVIANRFELEKLADSGGMGTIHRARDRQTGEVVAVKMLRPDAREHHARFRREASLLSALEHPHIVRYVDHGEAKDGELYLAMEWLDGEDLQQRLMRGPLDEGSVFTLARVAAAGLAYAHERGIVHRDLKPSNVFLIAGDPARAKIVDFGVARAPGRTALTEVGGLVGTPGYMAPEQVRGDSVDARSDVFALGCILFEAIAGRPAFSARDLLALMFKVLVEEPPSIHALRPGLPVSFSALVDRMLAKAPARRPVNAAVVAREMASMSRPASPKPVPRLVEARVPLLTESEQRMICIILSATPEAGPESAVTMLSDAHELERRARVRDICGQFGASVEWLAEGAILAVLYDDFASGDRTLVPSRSAMPVRNATDRVVLAARCALALQSAVPNVALAIGTGYAELRDALPVGLVVEHAVERLRRTAPGTLVVDDITARLLEPRFEIVEGQLLRERAALMVARMLLGRTSPFVGRDRELANLHAILDGCLEDRQAAAILITGRPGVGKSRLLHEFLAAIRERHPEVSVWSSCADPITGGVPLGGIAQVLRDAARIQQSEPNESAMAKFEAFVGGRLSGQRLDDARLMFSELFGSERDDASLVPNAATRLNPALRAERLRGGFLATIEAACAQSPVVIVIDDLQWADGASLRFLDAALGDLAEVPLLVLGVARPELREQLPSLWTKRRLEELRIANLRPSAARALVHRILGADASEATVERVIERADGNPFYLEELLRAVLAGRGDILPETVLAMATSRLDVLEPAARQVLRAGSVFGESFSQGDLHALLEGTIGREQSSDLLKRLVDDEVLVRPSQHDCEAQAHYRFRHAYLRDAAYSMLTEPDRVAGHRVAAEWLERGGRTEPAVLAEHYERAGDARTAAARYLAAARRAVSRSDPDGAIQLAERGIRSAAGDRELVDELRRLQARTHVWRGDFGEVADLADAMMASTEPGSKSWWSAAAHSLPATVWLGPRARVRRRLRLFYETAPASNAGAEYMHALGMVLPVIYVACAHELSEPLYQRFVGYASAKAERDVHIRARLAWLASARALVYLDDPWESLRLLREAIPLFEQSGDTQRSLHAQGEMALCLGDIGDFDAHEAENRRVLKLTSHMGLGPTIGCGFLGYNLASLGRTTVAREFAQWGLARALERGFSSGEGTARSALAAILHREGRLEEAEREALRAVRLTMTAPRYAALAFGTLARVRLERGRMAAALRASRGGMALLAAAGAVGPTEVGIRLVHAEALHAIGDVPAAHASMEDARTRVLARAARCSHAAARRQYLEGVPLVARTLALAEKWLGA